jgi:micrococcal nuclease
LAALATAALVVVVGQATRGQNVPKPPARDFTGAPAYKVVRVVDGDTTIVRIGDQDTRVRLIGVDTPETVHPTKPVEFHGPEASRFLTNLLKGESV